MQKTSFTMDLEDAKGTTVSHASELHALIMGSEFGFVTRGIVPELVGRYVSLEAYIDTKTVFDIISKDL